LSQKCTQKLGYKLESFHVQRHLRGEFKNFVFYNRLDQTYHLNSSVSLETLLDKYDTNTLDSITAEIGSASSKALKTDVVFADYFFERFHLSRKCPFKLVQECLRRELLNVRDFPESIQKIVATVVKDNVITDFEYRFLSQKFGELGLPLGLLDDIQRSLMRYSKSFDDLLHIIFEDRIITSEEILFLSEKIDERELPREVLIQRFWQIGFTYYPTTFSQLDGFARFLRLLLIKSCITGANIAFEYPDFLLFKNFAAVFSVPIYTLESEIIDLLSPVFVGVSSENIEFLFKSISISPILDQIAVDSSEDKSSITHAYLKTILEEERRRIGTPDAGLFLENIKFRLGI